MWCCVRPAVLPALVLVASALVSSCATQGVLRGNVFEKRDTSYEVVIPQDGWRRISLRNADLAFEHAGDGATLLVNALCTEEDVPLIALANHLLIGMTEQNTIEQKLLPWEGREALETTLTAKMDGVLRSFTTFVLKKDGCVYDIVLSAAPESFALHQPTYAGLRDAFRVGNKRL